jgi:hypothetical protein
MVNATDDHDTVDCLQNFVQRSWIESESQLPALTDENVQLLTHSRRHSYLTQRNST